MKALPKVLILSAILATLVGCGKSNESGKSGGSCLAFGPNGQCNAYSSGLGVNSPYSMSGLSLNQVLAENPCILSQGNYGPQMAMDRQVVQMNVQVQTMPGVFTSVPQGDIHVGVTSFGDVAAIIGNGTRNPTFVAYLCPGRVAGQAMLAPNILVGAATDCTFKPITVANIRFADGTQANFRSIFPGGSSLRQPFTFCRRN